MRTKKTLKNLFFNFLQQIVGIITNFIIPPLLIGNFGSAMNGLISTIRQLMSYARLAGAGISQSSTYALYEPLAQNDFKTVSGIYNAANKMFIHAGNIFTVIILILSIIYPFFIEGIDRFTVIGLIIIIGISGISEFYIYGKCQTIVNANQNNYVIAITQAIGNVANVIIFVLLINLKANIVLVQLGSSIVYVLRIFILMYYVKKKYPYLDAKIKPLTSRINQRHDAIVHQVAGLIVFSSSTIIISLICGLKAASVYSVYIIVFNGIDMICAIISTAIYASFGEIIAKKEKELLKNVFNIYEYIYFLLISIIFTVTYIMIMPFISLYTKNMFDTNYYLPILGMLFVFVGIANNLRVPAKTLVDAAGHYKKTRNKALIEMSINLFGQILFCFLFGIYGALLGCLLSYSYRTIDFIIYTNKNITLTSTATSVKRILVSFITGTVIISLVTTFLFINPENYYIWVFNSVVITLIVGVIYTIVYYILDRKTMFEITAIIKNLFIR